MSENKTTYESLDGKIAPEALLKDTRGKLQMVDGHGIKQEADYDDPDKLYGMLIARIQKYHPSADVTQIEKAYNLAKKAHGDQKRKSGEPYIIHPLWVAIILADLEMDKETIIAALLHDFFLDEVKHENEANKLRLHPGYAVKNASKYIDLTEKQIDIISTHMFPVTFTPPKYIESWIVDLLDDVAALYEKGYGIHRELRTSIYLLMLLVVNFVKIR